MLDSVYVPEHCLQGSEFSSYILYDMDLDIKFEISIPEAIQIKEIFNVAEDDYTFEGNILTINRTEINGYLGIVFKTRKCEKDSLREKIYIMAICNDDAEEIEKEIFLFRPNITVNEIPGKVDFNNKIVIENSGSGTAKIGVVFYEDSEVKKKRPHNIEEFVEKFWTEFENGVDQVKLEYPEYAHYVDQVVELWKLSNEVNKEDVVSDEQYMAEWKESIETLQEIMIDDNEFAKSFIEVLVAAYMSSVNVITSITGFFEYLKSIVEHRILLMDAMDIIEIEPPNKKLKGKLVITDLAKNTYEPIDISTELNIETDEKICIPIYSIFEWRDG